MPAAQAHAHTYYTQQGQAQHQPVQVQMLNMKTQKKGPANTLKMGIYADVRNALRSVNFHSLTLPRTIWLTLIKPKRRTTSGIRNAEMKWTDHSKLSTYGVRLVGWPDSVPMRNPSTLSVAQNTLVRQALDAGTMYFERMGHGDGRAVPETMMVVADWEGGNLRVVSPHLSVEIVGGEKVGEIEQEAKEDAEIPQESDGPVDLGDLPSWTREDENDEEVRTRL